ncbi:MAG: PD-(D/E)XK nuclease family protein [Gemmataceae bacterium]|nr:PD-(D/E)XK nuclease family protein [Gemmataceae bacterium]
MKWSFSADKCFRRCQRQYYFREIAACHNAKKVPVRRLAFLRKQLKTPELWRGLLVHEGIELFVVPRLLARQAIDWEEVLSETVAMARRQFAFSARGGYREPGVTKAQFPHEYCALTVHEGGGSFTEADLDAVLDSVRSAFRNLASMGELLRQLEGRARYWPELSLLVKYEGSNVEATPDLLYFRSFGHPTIVEWKTYDDSSNSDARLQMALYAWALCRHGGWRVSRPEDVELLEVQLLTRQVVRHACTEAVFAELEDHIYRSVHEIRALCGNGRYDELDLAEFAYARSPHTCQSCPFWALCLEG